MQQGGSEWFDQASCVQAARHARLVHHCRSAAIRSTSRTPPYLIGQDSDEEMRLARCTASSALTFTV
jgi:hypothetical protein